MHVLTPRHLLLLALVVPVIALVPLAPSPASAVRGAAGPPALAVSEWSTASFTLPDEPYRQVLVTYDATYGVTLDGQVRSAAGYSYGDDYDVPTFPEPIVQVAASGTAGLALGESGHLHPWGDRFTVPEELSDTTFRDVSVFDRQVVALTASGEVETWGTPSNQEELDFDPTELDGRTFIDVVTGYGGSVALTDDGQVVSAGAFLDGTNGPAQAFPADRRDEKVVAIDVGNANAMALTDDGKVIAWGAGFEGQRDVPTSLADETAVAISVGEYTSGAVTADGDVVTWGDPPEGENPRVPTLRDDATVVDLDLARYRSAVTYARLTSTTAPVITGTPQFGTELTATSDEWSSAPDNLHYEWFLHAYGTTTAVGTDSSTYTPTAQDALDFGTLTVTVTAEKDGFVSGTATSAETDHVAQLQFTTAPTLTLDGQARVGGSITAVATDAVPVPDSGEYMWFTVVRGDDPDDSDDDDVTPIDGADTATLELTPDLAGKTVFANLTVLKEGYTPAWGETADVVVAPAPVVAPGTLTAPTVTVTGTPEVGRTITATATGTTPAADRVDYAWYARTGPAADQVTAIAGATGPALTLTADLVGKTVLARATASKAGYTTVAADSAGLVVAPGSLTAPTVTVTGAPRVGETLTSTTTTDPLATTTRYQWLRGATPILGATTATYRATSTDLGEALRVQVTTDAAGRNDATGTSAATAPVTLAPARLKVAAPKKVTAGKLATIRVRHLAAGEKVVVTVGGAKVTGRANAAGVATVKVKVEGKRGKRAVRAVGSLPDRSGRTTLRVVPPRRQ